MLAVASKRVKALIIERGAGRWGASRKIVEGKNFVMTKKIFKRQTENRKCEHCTTG
jgi:hypothetical protein